MKTPMQEMLEWVRATLPMDLEWPRVIEEKVESMLEKEKEVITDAYEVGRVDNIMYDNYEDYYEQTYGGNNEQQ